MNKRDLLLAGGVLLVAALLFWLWPTQSQPAQELLQVEVRRAGEVILSVPLAEEGTYDLSGSRGAENVLRVEEGRASMLSANCPDQLCVLQGALEGTSGSIVCLPHRLVVRLSGALPAGDAPDVIAR